VVAHFCGNRYKCDTSHVTVTPVEFIDGTMPDLVNHMKEREDHWIKTLCTLYPYGMNDKLENQPTTMPKSVYALFSITSRSASNHRGKQTRKTRTVQAFNAQEVFDGYKEVFMSKNRMHACRTMIHQLTNNERTTMADWLLEYANDDGEIEHVKMTYNDMMITLMPEQKHKHRERNDDTTIRWVMTLVNQGFNDLDMPKILHNKELMDLVPARASIRAPSIAWRYTQPIRNSILNYRKTVTTDITHTDFNRHMTAHTRSIRLATYNASTTNIKHYIPTYDFNSTAQTFNMSLPSIMPPLQLHKHLHTQACTHMGRYHKAKKAAAVERVKDTRKESEYERPTTTTKENITQTNNTKNIHTRQQTETQDKTDKETEKYNDTMKTMYDEWMKGMEIYEQTNFYQQMTNKWKKKWDNEEKGKDKKNTRKKTDTDEIRNQKASDEQCQCNQTYRDHKIGHVQTGDLGIIKNEALRQLIKKGPNYREPRPYNFDDIRNEISETIEPTMIKWANREDINAYEWGEWREKLNELITEKCDELKKRTWPANDIIMKQKEVKKELEDLHDRYVLVPADKAQNNILVICKAYYKQQLVNELTKAKNCAYEKVTRTKDDIINDMITASVRYRIPVPEEWADLAIFYATGKMHKDPVALRFIAASSRCANKPLSHTLTMILKLIKDTLTTKYNKQSKTTGIQKMWIIDNNLPFIDRLKKCNERGKVKDIRVYDFKTLYTNIMHDDLIKQLEWVLEDAFDFKDKENRGAGTNKIQVDAKEAKWTKGEKNDTRGYTKKTILEMITQLVKNIYFTCGDQVFRQKIGIPMGTDCAPLLANLYLFARECQWLNSLLDSGDEGRKMSRYFQAVGRYIDDLFILDSEGNFDRFIPEIYPKSLVLERQGKEDHTANYLDMTVTINNGKFITKLYDKRRDFHFDIIKYTYLPSNTNYKQVYNALIGQCLRYANTNTLYDDFVRCVRRDIDDLQRKNGLNITEMKRTLGTFTSNHRKA
jgi:hypothetical protein